MRGFCMPLTTLHGERIQNITSEYGAQAISKILYHSIVEESTLHNILTK